MNIIFLLQDTGRLYGAEQATVDLASLLQEVPGVSCHLLLIEETRLPHRAEDLRLALCERGLSFTTIPTAHAFSPRLIREIRKHVRKLNGHLLHTSGYKADIHGLPACRKQVPLVSTVHGWLCRPDLKERFYGWLNLRFLRHFDRVIVLSRHYREHLAACGIAEDRLVRIPSGLNTPPNVTPSPRPADRPFTVGILGRLSWEKNHALFVEAASSVHRTAPDIRFLIAGDGPEKQSIQNLVAQAGLNECINMPGFMDKNEFFSAIDLMVLCSRIENLPFSILQAMARDVPVVATNVGGIPDLIEHEATGLLSTQESSSLAEAILRLANETELASKLATNAREKLRREFSVETWRDSHINHYRKLAGDAAARSSQ
jgi:glycosyltransferase involved in cell wall biosynthesis